MRVCLAGSRGVAIEAALLDGGQGVAAAKRAYLEASTAAGRQGRLTTGARYFITYMTHVVGMTPIQPADASPALRRQSCLHSLATSPLGAPFRWHGWPAASHLAPN